MKSESWADYLQEMWSTSEEAKYKSKGPIYILHLFALAAIGLFYLCIFEKKKAGFGKVTDEKSVEGGIFVEKGRV